MLIGKTCLSIMITREEASNHQDLKAQLADPPKCLAPWASKELGGSRDDNIRRAEMTGSAAGFVRRGDRQE
jgi:hypothetical protein